MNTSKKRSDLFASYRDQIKVNVEKLQQIKKDQANLNSAIKKARNLKIPNLPIESDLELHSHYAISFDNVDKTHEEIVKLNKQIQIEKLKTFNAEAETILKKDVDLIFQDQFHVQLQKDLKQEPVRIDLDEKINNSNLLKQELKTYQSQLKPNIERLERTMLLANNHLTSKNDETQHQIIALKSDIKPKIFYYSFQTWMVVMGILLGILLIVGLALGLSLE